MKHYIDTEKIEDGFRKEYEISCQFCEISTNPTNLKTELIYWDDEKFVIEPLNPVTYGHLIVIPRKHYGFSMGEMFNTAVHFGEKSGKHYNIIMNKGEYASQTIDHTHIHIVPRDELDGLLLPWSNQKTEKQLQASELE